MAPRDVYTPGSIQKDLPTPVQTPTQSIKNGVSDLFSSVPGLRSSTESSTRSALTYLNKWGLDTVNWLKERWGWVVTLSTFMLFLVTYGFFACYGLLFVSFQEEFDSGATETGWVGSLASAIAHFAGPLTNFLVQKLHSPRRVVFIGVACCFIGLMVSSFAPSIYFLFGSMGIVCGLGLNMLSQTTLVLIVQYFPDKNSTRSVSIVCTGLTIGMLILSPIVNCALESIGWRATLRYAGIGVLAVGSLCSLPMLPVRHKTRNMQRHLNLSRSRFSLLKEDVQDYPKPVEETPGLEEKRSIEDARSNVDCVSLTKPQTSILRRGKMWVLCGCMFITAIAQTFYNINYVGHLKVLGISGDQSAIMITLYAAGQIAGELLLSIFAEKLPCHKIYLIAISSLLGGLATTPIIFLSSAPLLKAISTVLGFLRAPRTVLVLPVAIEIFGVSHVQQVSAAVLVAHGVGFVVGALVMGITFDHTGSYELSIEICITLLITASLLYISVPLRSRLKKKSKHSDNPLNQVQDEEASEECNIVPMSNLVAPVREIVPFLVSSQESLNRLDRSPDVIPDDHWIDYHNNRSPDFLDHSNGVEDLQGMKTITNALRDDLFIHLIVTNDVIIHMPHQSSTATPVSVVAQRSSIDNLITELSQSAGTSRNMIERLPSVDDVAGPSYRLRDFDCQKVSIDTDSPQSFDDLKSNQASSSFASPDYNYDDDNPISSSQNGFVNDNCGTGTPSLIENPLNVYLSNLIGYESNAIASNDPLNDSHGRPNIIDSHGRPNIIDTRGNPNVIENPLSEICDDMIRSKSNAETPNDCTVSTVLMNDHSTQTVIGQSCELVNNALNSDVLTDQFSQIQSNFQLDQTTNSDVLADNDILTNLDKIDEFINEYRCISDTFSEESLAIDKSSDLTHTSVEAIDQTCDIDEVALDQSNSVNNVLINYREESPIIDYADDFIDPNRSPEALIDFRIATNEIRYKNLDTNEIGLTEAYDDVSIDQPNILINQHEINDQFDNNIDPCRSPDGEALIDLCTDTNEVIYKNHGTNHLIIL